MEDDTDATGALWLQVGAEPGELATPFTGQKPRLEKGVLHFHWNSEVNRIQEVAGQFAAGKLTLKKALKQLAEYDDLDDEALRDIASGASDPTSLVYQEQDDRPALHAGEALDLPPWASLKQRGAGGPGSGYDGCYVVLAPGKTLEHLAAWLAAQGA
jgi:hypothetical protein